MDVLGQAYDYGSYLAGRPGGGDYLRDPYHDNDSGAAAVWGPKAQRQVTRSIRYGNTQFFETVTSWVDIPEIELAAEASTETFRIGGASSTVIRNRRPAWMRSVPAGWATSAGSRTRDDNDRWKSCGSVKSRHSGYRWDIEGADLAEGQASTGSCARECSVAVSFAEGSAAGTLTVYRDWEMVVTLSRYTRWRAPSGGAAAGICESTTQRWGGGGTCTFTQSRPKTVPITPPQIPRLYH